MAEEVWWPVPGYEELYEVSDLGRVRSLPRGWRKGVKVLKHGRSGQSGYHSVALCRDGVPRTRYVHHLVALAFLGPRPKDLDVCHNNGDLNDNSRVNLRYGTVSSNNRDSVQHRRHHESRKETCDRGHPLTGENVAIERNGISADGVQKWRRRCRTCAKARNHNKQ